MSAWVCNSSPWFDTAFLVLVDSLEMPVFVMDHSVVGQKGVLLLCVRLFHGAHDFVNIIVLTQC